MSKLNKYNHKRNFAKTTEPKGKVEKKNKILRYVVQYHLASREHYDFRLEWNGSLKSWAVPKGPTYNSSDKRLAIEVEDHPIEYRNYEGNIPKGEYGGGSIMIWDEGYWEPLEYEGNSIKFILYGKRLMGKWALVRMEENNWLLIKEKDEFSNYDINITELNTSVRTNRTIKEISVEQ